MSVPDRLWSALCVCTTDRVAADAQMPSRGEAPGQGGAEDVQSSASPPAPKGPARGGGPSLLMMKYANHYVYNEYTLNTGVPILRIHVKSIPDAYCAACGGTVVCCLRVIGIA